MEDQQKQPSIKYQMFGVKPTQNGSLYQQNQNKDGQFKNGTYQNQGNKHLLFGANKVNSQNISQTEPFKRKQLVHGVGQQMIKQTSINQDKKQPQHHLTTKQVKIDLNSRDQQSIPVNMLSTSNLMESIQNPLIKNIDPNTQSATGISQSHTIGSLASNNIQISSKSNVYLNKKGTNNIHNQLQGNTGTQTTKNASLGVNLSSQSSSKPSLQNFNKHNIGSAGRGHLSSSGIGGIAQRGGDNKTLDHSNQNMLSTQNQNISNSSSHIDSSISPLKGISHAMMSSDQQSNQKYGNILRFRNMPGKSEPIQASRESLGNQSSVNRNGATFQIRQSNINFTETGQFGNQNGLKIPISTVNKAHSNTNESNSMRLNNSITLTNNRQDLVQNSNSINIKGNTGQKFTDALRTPSASSNKHSMDNSSINIVNHPRMDHNNNQQWSQWQNMSKNDVSLSDSLIKNRNTQDGQQHQRNVGNRYLNTTQGSSNGASIIKNSVRNTEEKKNEFSENQQNLIFNKRAGSNIQQQNLVQSTQKRQILLIKDQVDTDATPTGKNDQNERYNFQIPKYPAMQGDNLQRQQSDTLQGSLRYDAKNDLLKVSYDYLQLINNDSKSSLQYPNSGQQIKQQFPAKSTKGVPFSNLQLLTNMPPKDKVLSPKSQFQMIQKNKELITIHVFDENRKVNKDFKCQRDLLVKYMKYFEVYLTEATSVDDIDISVHCDIKIFEWLIRYLHHREKMIKNIGNTKWNNRFVAKHNQYKRKTEEEKQKEKDLKPELDSVPVIDLKNVISILISSDFLQMQDLVNECVSYVVSNLHDVVRLPIDMSCLNMNLIRQIADKVPLERLDKLPDKRDKLTSKLFQKKLEKLVFLLEKQDTHGLYTSNLHECLWLSKLNVAFEHAQQNHSGDVNVFDEEFDVPNALSYPEYIDVFESKEGDEHDYSIECCNNCFKLYTTSQNQAQACAKAKININHQGQIVSQHEKDQYFNFQTLISQLSTTRGLKWKEIFWKIWAQVQIFKCIKCDQNFSGSDVNNCLYHPCIAKFEDESHLGVYPCCNQQTVKFNAKDLERGCKSQAHSIDLLGVDFDNQIFEILINHQDICLGKIDSIDESGIDEDLQNKKDLMFFVDLYLEELRIKKQRKSVVKSKLGNKERDLNDPPPNLITGDFRPAAQNHTRNKRLERRNTAELKIRRNLDQKDNKGSSHNALETTDKRETMQSTQRENKYGYALKSNQGQHPARLKNKSKLKKTPIQKYQKPQDKVIDQPILNTGEQSIEEEDPMIEAEYEDELDEDDETDSQESDELDPNNEYASEADYGSEQENDKSNIEIEEQEYIQRKPKKKIKQKQKENSTSTAATMITEQDQSRQLLQVPIIYQPPVPMVSIPTYKSDKNSSYFESLSCNDNLFVKSRRKMNYMHNKGKKLVQNSEVPALCGLGNDTITQNIEVPFILVGQMGTIGGQINDPFEKISRAQYKERKNYRRDFLHKIDEMQTKDLAKQLKKMRIPEQIKRKKRKDQNGDNSHLQQVTAQTILDKGDDKSGMIDKNVLDEQLKKPLKLKTGTVNQQLSMGTGVLSQIGSQSTNMYLNDRRKDVKNNASDSFNIALTQNIKDERNGVNTVCNYNFPMHNAGYQKIKSIKK